MDFRFLNPFRKQRRNKVERLRERLGFFRDLVDRNDRVLKLMAEAGEKLGGEYVFDTKYLHDLVSEMKELVHGIVMDLNGITGNRYPELVEILGAIDAGFEAALDLRTVVPEAPTILPLARAGMEDLEIVGEKMARLGEVKAQLGLVVPGGWVVSTHACREFLEQAGLLADAEALLSRPPAGERQRTERGNDLRERILRAPLPRKMRRALDREVGRLSQETGCTHFAVRSSAPGEDGSGRWAGQFGTVLGVPPDGVVEAYREVVATMFSPSALALIQEDETGESPGIMAVGVMAMVSARASGVVYSLDPLNPNANLQIVTATWGLGKGVVDGEIPVDRFELSREAGFPVRARQIGHKSALYGLAAGKRIALQEVPETRRDVPSVSDEELARIGEAACRIERYMRCAQDIEWSIDESGVLFILQTRPLTLLPDFQPQERDLSEVVGTYPVLLRGKGEVACRGIGSGPVRIVDRPLDLSVEEARGCVLVARSASPKLGKVVGGAAAVLTDSGSATGHLAAVARELRVPTIVGTQVATTSLTEEQVVTVDAEENVVYEGQVSELLQYQLLRDSSFQDSREFRILRRLLRKVAPLHLNDPQSPDFSPAGCVTYHDIIRFAHEKAVVALSNLSGVIPSGRGGQIHRLELPIPLDLVVIDLGGGLSGDFTGVASFANLSCRPLLPLLEVLAGDGGWETGPADMDLDGFMASATRGAPLMSAMGTRPEQNLAIVSDEYLHLSLKLGYHFNVVDATLTDRPEDNYIYFRFAGGVTELTRRSRRAAVLRKILEHHGFVVEGAGDLVIARLRSPPAEAMVRLMGMVGRLIGFTRQLDIFLKEDGHVEEYVERFLESGWR